MPRKTLDERFWEKVDTSDGVDACWPWTASKTVEGYGQFYRGGRLVLAHRVAYELVNGPIPEGLEIDHVRANGCTRKDCQNALSHLEAVPHAENVKRGLVGDKGRHEAEKTHCPQGHPYAGDNLYIAPKTGARHCKACRREAARRAYWRNAA